MTPIIAVALAAALMAAQGPEEVPRYDMEARFAADMRAVTVTGVLHVPGSLMKRDTLELRLSALFRDLRFREEGGRAVTVLPIGDTTGDRRNYRLVARGGGDTVRLRFAYSGGRGIG